MKIKSPPVGLLSLIFMLSLINSSFVEGAVAAKFQSDAETEKQLLAAVKEAEASKGAQLASALDNLAAFYKKQKKFAEAEKLYKRSLEAHKKAFGSQDVSVAATFNNIADINQEQGKYDKAESLYWEAIKILDKLEDAEHPEMTRSLHQLLKVYIVQGKSDKVQNLSSAIPIIYAISGTVADGKYTSIEGDFIVSIPELFKPGARIRDEISKKDKSSVSQVMFTDSFGSYYRILSVADEAELVSTKSVLTIYPNAKEIQALRTLRGEETRFINLEQEGAQITITTYKGGKPEQTKKPDLLTANALFIANNRIYFVIAGVSLIRQMADDSAARQAKERLEKLLAGLTIVSKSK